MNRFFILILSIIILAIFFIVYELGKMAKRQHQRKEIFNMATERKKITRKPLLVVGSPTEGSSSKWLGTTYGCGDMCVDIVGCSSCKNQKKVSLEEFLPLQEDNSYVIYISCVLEYMDNLDNLDELEKELHRVSGGDLFIVHIKSDTFTSFLYWGGPTPKWRIHKAPPFSDSIRYCRNIMHKKKSK